MSVCTVRFAVERLLSVHVAHGEIFGCVGTLGLAYNERAVAHGRMSSLHILMNIKAMIETLLTYLLILTSMFVAIFVARSTLSTSFYYLVLSAHATVLD